MSVTYAKVVVEDSSDHIAQTSAKADQLKTARTIGGVSFNGTANINLPGVNATGNQETTGASGSLKSSGAISASGDVSTSAGVTYTSGGAVALTLGINDNKLEPGMFKGPLTNKLGNGTNGQVLKSSGNGTFLWGSAGGVTEVTVGTGLDVSNGTTTPSVTLDLSELADGTADVVGSEDKMVYLDNGTQKSKHLDDIKLSQFSNDSGWASGTVTSVATGKGLSGTVTSTGTINLSFGNLDESTGFTGGNAINGEVDMLVGYDDSSSKAVQIGYNKIPVSFFNNDSGFTSNVGDITGVTAGTGLTGGGSSGGVTVNVVGGTGVTANANDIAIGQDVATDADVTFANLTLSGDLTVSGSTITTTTETLEIADNTMVLNSDLTGTAVDAGLCVERGSSGNNQFLFWDESASGWSVGNGSSTSFPSASARLQTQKVSSSLDATDTSVPVGGTQIVGGALYLRTN